MKLADAVLGLIAAAPQLAAAFSHEAIGGTCSWDSKSGAHFDLQALVRTGDQPSYAITDGDIPCTPGIESNYSYSFNVCNSMSGPLPNTKCADKAGGSALQVNKRGTDDPSDDYCEKAGAWDPSNGDVSWFELINNADPTEGVRLTYVGDNCHHDNSGAEVSTPRKFMMEFTCGTSLSAVPVHALEYSHCEYTVSIPSVFGCPTECPVGTDKETGVRGLCGGHGHCKYDYDQNAAHCFCDHGYYGDDCTATSLTSGGGASTAVTVVIALLVVVVTGLVGVTVWLRKQVGGFRDDATNYMQLQGQEMGDMDSGV